MQIRSADDEEIVGPVAVSNLAWLLAGPSYAIPRRRGGRTHPTLMNRSTLLLCGVAAALASDLLAQYPQSSTLPRGEVRLNSTVLDNNTLGFGHWRVAAPAERLPAGPAGTVPTANVAYVTYVEANALGQATIQFRRTRNGGFTWEPATTLHTVAAGEAIDGAETRLVARGHEVFVVYASNGHTLVAGQQAVFAIGSADQGQTWSAPVLLSTGSLLTLRDVDEVNAACSAAAANGPASLNVVFESDYNVPVSGVEDLFFVQAQLQAGVLTITVPEQRLNLAVAARASDVNFTAIAADGPVVHIAWTDNRAGGGTSQYDYFSLTSRANGADFATTVEKRHTQFGAPLAWAAPRRPQVAVDLPHVYTFMEHALNGQDDVWMDWSSDLGVSWPVTGVAINTATLGAAGDVDDMLVTAHDGRVAVLYVDDRLNGTNNNDNNQAIVSVSLNAGADFAAGTHVERPLSLKDPNPIFGISMVGDLIVALYETNCVLTTASGAEDLTISLSSDAGVTWTHRDVTSYGGCGTFPSGVDVDDPRLALTLNGDAIVTWIDDRTILGGGGGNTVNNQWITSIHYPQLIDNTAAFQGVAYVDDSPASIGHACFVLVSASGTGSQSVLDTVGGNLNLAFDVFTEASVIIATSAPSPNLNQAPVGANGAVQFPLLPNVTQLLGLPIWAAAVTIAPGTSVASRFTDPIRFQ